MKPAVTTRQVARYIGARHKNAVKLGRFFGDMAGQAPATSQIEKHYLDVALSYAEQAAQWREIARDLKTGTMATYRT